MDAEFLSKTSCRQQLSLPYVCCPHHPQAVAVCQRLRLVPFHAFSSAATVSKFRKGCKQWGEDEGIKEDEGLHLYLSHLAVNALQYVPSQTRERSLWVFQFLQLFSYAFLWYFYSKLEWVWPWMRIKQQDTDLQRGWLSSRPLPVFSQFLWTA